MRIRTTIILASVMVILHWVLNFGAMTGSANLATAADAAIHGVVTDNEGRPLRGATVKATLGTRAISRFTDKDGRYQIAGLQPGRYQVSVTVLGFASQAQTRDMAQGGNTNFALERSWDPNQLSSAELSSFLPANAEVRFLEANVHRNLIHPFLMRGMRAKQWEAAIEREREAGRWAHQGYIDINPTWVTGGVRLSYTIRLLEKYFGPDSPEPTPDKVKHAEVSDAALQATFYEFDIPTYGSYSHSIAVDNNGNGWFSEWNQEANNFGKLNFETGTITEYPIPFPRSSPHTPVIDKAGRVWMPLDNANRLSYLDPAEGKVHVVPEKSPGAHSLKLDQDGNIWGTSGRGGEGVYKFDKTTGKFREYLAPLPNKLPENSMDADALMPGEPQPTKINGTTYSLDFDSKGMLWYSQFRLGILVRLDPRTGEQTPYKFPGVHTARGVAVDSNDNIWFSNWGGHKIVKYDQKKEQVKMYQPPTQFATAYGLVFNKKNGHLWYADTNGNNITRFDPVTEQFVEYPIPSHDATPSFIDVDDQGRIWFTEWWPNKVGVLVPGQSSKPSSSVASVR